jgi:hypothetical protein
MSVYIKTAGKTAKEKKKIFVGVPVVVKWSCEWNTSCR